MARHQTQYAPSCYLDFAAPQSMVDQNALRLRGIDSAPLPTWDQFASEIPAIHWPMNPAAEDCWQEVWKLAHKNLRRSGPANGFIANYIDTAFNGNLFMWDSVFILMFARYGARAFDFQRTLDNFYHRQRIDGWIGRELRPFPGGSLFHPHDPASTGPNVLAWCEWEHFCCNGDKQRLAEVFPALVGYHRWMRKYRTWQDGSYFSCGLACGMDNQTRVGQDYDPHTDHGHLSWIDATSQALFSARLLVKMADVLGRPGDVECEQTEIRRLDDWINTHAWSEADGFYYDTHPETGHSGVKSIAAWWTLLAGAARGQRATRLATWLADEQTFNRPHRVPTLSADAQTYCPHGGYWLGSVWPPTNYMVLRGLSQVGQDELAWQIGRNHLDNVLAVFEKTGTVWENYAPESADPGKPAKRDFVGWGGLGPVAVLLEYVFGLRSSVPENTLTWDIRLTDAFGVDRLGFGHGGVLCLHCRQRQSETDPPRLGVESNRQMTLHVRWAGGQQRISLTEGKVELTCQSD